MLPKTDSPNEHSRIWCGIDIHEHTLSMNMVEVSVSKGFMRAPLGLSVLYLSHV